MNIGRTVKDTDRWVRPPTKRQIALSQGNRSETLQIGKKFVRSARSLVDAAGAAKSASEPAFTPNTDPAHEAAETPEQEADEQSGKFRNGRGGDGLGGHHGGFNHDPAHEAAESPARAEETAEEAVESVA